MNNKKLAFAVLAFMLVVAVAAVGRIAVYDAAYNYEHPAALVNPSPAAMSDGVHFAGAVVTVEVYRPGVGVIYHEVSHNTVTDEGKNYLAALIGSTNAGLGPMKYIGLSNNTTHAVAAGTTGAYWKSDVIELQAAGCTRQPFATYYNNTPSAGNPGNWTLSYTWTATGPQNNIRIAAVFNDTYANTGKILSEATFASLVNLSALDSLTVNYTYWFT